MLLMSLLYADLRSEWMNLADVCGDTPLHVASTYGFLDCMRLLLDSAANFNAKVITTSKWLGYCTLLC